MTMATYTPATIAKSLAAFATATIGAATAAAHGVDLSVLDAGQWLTAIGAGLTAGGAVFATPNKSHQSSAEQVVTGLQAVIDAKSQADADIDKVKAAAQDALGQVPVVGPLAQRVINSIHLP